MYLEQRHAHLLDELLLLPGLPIICGDFNCPGVDPVTVDQHLSDTLSSRDLDQVVTQPTHQAGNLLDWLITMIRRYISQQCRGT